MRPGVLLLAASLALGLPAAAEDKSRAGPERPSEAWTEIHDQLWPGLEITDAGTSVSIEAPYRAHDAAIVPVSVSVDPGFGRTVKKLTLIVDENPAPIAAEFEFGEKMGPKIAFSTRLRVNAYSNVRAVVELDDGTLLNHARFVKASGGCGAPALKNADVAMSELGRMKMRHFASADAGGAETGLREAQVMIRHPNNTGFQMNPITNLYVPAFFLHEIAVTEGEEVLFSMTGGISLSEDPSIRFTYRSEGGQPLTVRAADTDGGEFVRSFAGVDSGA